MIRERNASWLAMTLTGALCLSGCAGTSDGGPANAERQSARADFLAVPTQIHGHPVVLREIHHDVAAPLRVIPVPAPGGGVSMRRTRMPAIGPFPSAPSQPDSVVQTTAGPLLSVTPGLNFDGVSDNLDDNGAVGATQFLQWTNAGFGVFDKSTGVMQFGPAASSSFWVSPA